MEAALDLNRTENCRANLIETVYNIMRPYVPYHYVANHIRAAARLLAEYHPPELAHIINRFPTISHKTAFDMLQQAERYIQRRYGRRDRAMIIGIWLRRAAEGRPYPAVNQKPA